MSLQVNKLTTRKAFHSPLPFGEGLGVRLRGVKVRPRGAKVRPKGAGG